ncbi:MAG: hypothetical protein DDT31_01760 [Syntrophomonadaceae bacterium]|nr:hypothetical protein [Bacillota bacterium]
MKDEDEKEDDDEDEVQETKPAKIKNSAQTIRGYVYSLIQKGEYSKKEIESMAFEKFPDLKKSTLSTLLSDGKNPKYNRFPTLIKTNDKGVFECLSKEK